MDQRYRRYIFWTLIFIFTFNIIYFEQTAENENSEQARIVTQYKANPVAGALQPLPDIVAIDKRWVALGKALFHSPLLSKNNTVACASCHLINSGGDDGFPVSVGINGLTGTRNAPTVLNSSLNFKQFWDGRNVTLAEQAAGPIHNPIEMNSNFDEVIPKLKADKTFNQTFSQLSQKGVTADNIVLAIATFEESLLTPNAPIDKYLLGDKNALNEQQKRGLTKFTNFGCIACHQGRNIGGNLFQRIGRIDSAPPHLLKDKGRYQVTQKQNDLHVYKVPSLRNIAETAPYFHNGKVDNLPDAVKLMARMQLGTELSEADIIDIVALLQAFTGELQVDANE